MVYKLPKTRTGKRLNLLEGYFKLKPIKPINDTNFRFAYKIENSTTGQDYDGEYELEKVDVNNKLFTFKEVEQPFEDSTFKFHTDSGHGWVEVPKSSLKELEIENEISSYSYQTKDKVYLEEDNDAGIFFKAFVKKYGKKPKNSEVDDGNVSYIRNLESYEK